jgi:Domain of unknown function (DUF4288)
MANEVWWSASLWLVVFVGGRPLDEVESVVLLRAPEAAWPIAEKRAIEIGHGMERSYVNADGDGVVWRLGGVRTLDQLEAEVADGREVYGTVRRADSALEPDGLRPEDQRPTQTGV